VFDVRTAVLCSLFPILALTATAGAAEDKPRPAQDRPVLVQPVHFESRTPDRSFVAVVRPRIETDLGFRIAGKVSRRLVEVGQSVAAGQELADLDPTDLVLQREQAEAELRAAVSSLTQTAADEKRLSDLKARGWTPDATYDKQRTALAEAQARRDRAERSVVLARNALTYATLRADTDGIVCLSATKGEAPAAERLRSLLAQALGSFDLQQLLATADPKGSKSETLDEWLRDEFFEQHAKLFHHRPFLWHIWDGRKDGFSAIVNYHKLDQATLQKLTYTYLGNWIHTQESDAKADKPGAAERLGAAQAP
jgi:multidrug efflux pump subunit AcrA (membrane-fusion protein)